MLIFTLLAVLGLLYYGRKHSHLWEGDLHGKCLDALVINLLRGD